MIHEQNLYCNYLYVNENYRIIATYNVQEKGSITIILHLTVGNKYRLISIY